MNVLITGASRGIGQETAKSFLSNGHKVLAISRNTQPLEQLKKEGASTLTFDLISKNYTPLVQKVADFGPIDILINNAGALVNKPFTQLTDEDIKYVYEVNVFSVFKVIRDLMPHYGPHAHIINISSVGGVQGSIKFPGLSAYSSSKGALTILTECLAEEYKSTTYRFNALALGSVQTEMLQEAFPDFKSPVTAVQMANYIYNFAIQHGELFNGKVLQVSSSTP